MTELPSKDILQRQLEKSLEEARLKAGRCFAIKIQVPAGFPQIALTDVGSIKQLITVFVMLLFPERFKGVQFRER